MKRHIFIVFSLLVFQSCHDNSVKQLKVQDNISIKDSINNITESKMDVDVTNNESVFYVLNNQYIVFKEGDYYDLSEGNAIQAYSNEVNSAIKNINYNMIDKSISKYLNSNFTIVDSNNEKHSVTIESRLLYSKYYPHFGESANWYQNNLTNEEIAQAIWQSSVEHKHSIYIVGKTNKIVSDSVIAYNMKNTAVVYSVIDNYQSEEIQNICKSTKEYKQFLEDMKNVKDSTKYVHDFNITKYTNTSDGSEIFYTNLTTGNPCGGEYFYSQVFIVKMEGDNYCIINDYHPYHSEPEAVFRFNDDQYPDFLYNLPMNRLEKHIDSLNKKYIDLTIQYYDCGC